LLCVFLVFHQDVEETGSEAAQAEAQRLQKLVDQLQKEKDQANSDIAALLERQTAMTTQNADLQQSLRSGEQRRREGGKAGGGGL
jgi:predicted  nucleic acid-binding Zn-ribbon protein